MRHVVLEGPDNGGKSTLAQYLSPRLQLPIQHSGGPEQYPGEINTRVRKYLDYKQAHIFDRHPCISQEIYRTIRNTNNGEVDVGLIKEFYATQPLLIYCRPLLTELGDNHIPKHNAYDTEQHLREIKDHYSRLVVMYDAWALEKAHVIYRIGVDYKNIAGFIRGYS